MRKNQNKILKGNSEKRLRGRSVKKSQLNKERTKEGNMYKINDFLTNLRNGFIMGMADIIPGISGATIALIMNFYDKLIDSFSYVISNLFSKRLFSKQLVFLINLYLGVFLGMIFLGKIILSGFQNYRPLTYAFFVGVILASIFVLIKDNYNKIKQKLIWLIIGVVFGYLILSFKISLAHTAWNLFLSGIFAISAMLLPGISGSYVLVMLGQYEFVLNAIKNKDVIVAYFIIGILIGLAVMSKLIKWLITRYHDQTISFLIGLMIIGLKTPIKEINSFSIGIIISIVSGIIVVLILRILAKKKENERKR